MGNLWNEITGKGNKMKYIRREWKLFVVVLIMALSSGIALYISKKAEVTEFVEDSIQVVDPVKAIVAAIIMLAIGVIIYCVRNSASYIEKNYS